MRCAELVRDGKADAMVSAGNTGAAMAAALLRMGRIKGVARPAIAVPIPVPGHAPADPGRRRRHGRLHAPSGCASSRSWAASTRACASAIDEPRVGLLSNGEEPGKGDDLRKTAYPLLETMPGLHRQRRGPRLHARHAST